MSTDSPKYETHFYGSVQGVVIGDKNVVTFIFHNGEQLTVPFLAPPLPPYHLIGRDKLLQELKQRLLAGSNLALFALNGLPGVGKTALAVALAHDRDVLTHFRDGVLWAKLGRNANALLTLSKWGKTLGISEVQAIRLTSVEAWAEAIHTAIGTRRMLLVIDDAWEVETALAFRIGGPNSGHLVTTRLPEVAVHFANQGTSIVNELNETDSLSLLAQFVPEVIKAEPEEAKELIQAVGGLPLALVLIGNYLRIQTLSGKQRRVRTALDRLKQVEVRLQLAQPQSPLERHPSLSEGAKISLESIIAISDEALSEESRYTLRALSAFPPKPNTFSEEAALVVASKPIETIDMLDDYGLLEDGGQNRYMLHQTIADYAKLRLSDESPYERMVRFFVSYMEVNKKDYNLLTLETSNILSALQIASDGNMLEDLLRGANTFHYYLLSRGLYTLDEPLLLKAKQAAKILSDTKGEATTLFNLGKIADKSGNFELAEQYFREGIDLVRISSDLDQSINLLDGLGWIIGQRGDFKQAVTFFKEGLTLAREMNSGEQIPNLLQGLGWASGKLGNFEQAHEYLEEGLYLAREAGNNEQIADLLQVAGWMTGIPGNFGKAELYFQECLTLARKINHTERIIDSLLGLGWLDARRGNFRQAEDRFQEALALAREIDHREQESLLANLGWVSRELGNLEQAEMYFLEGLILARKIGNTEKVSILLTELGNIRCKLGDFRQAEVYLQESLTLAREIGQNLRVIDTLRNLGVVACESRKFEQAEAYLYEGLTLAREANDAWNICNLLIEWGELNLKQREPSPADTAFQETLQLAREIGSQDLIATALYGLARITAIQEDITRARSLGQESLTIFENIEHSKASDVRQWIATLS